MKYWKYLLALLGAVFGVLVSIALLKRSELLDVKTQFRAIDAEAEVKKLEAEQGKQAALNVVVAEHEKLLEELDDQQQEQAAALRDDPGALARFLVRAGKRKA